MSVTVKQINSRRVYITGHGRQARPVQHDRADDRAAAHRRWPGGLQEFADKKNIMVIRKEAGKDLFYKVNYDDISKGKNLGQNIELRPGDIVIVK